MTDNEIIRGIRENSSAVWRELYFSVKGGIRTRIEPLLKDVRHLTFDDLFDDACLTLMNHVKDGTLEEGDGTNLSGYLFTICQRNALRQRARELRPKELPKPENRMNGNAGMEIKVGIELDADKWNDIAQQAANSFKSVMTDTLVSLSESIGTLMGDLATGKDGWGDFANSAVQAFGDMAIAVGKIAIEAGTSVLALKAAMTSMSTAGAYAAIAAGAALVILGSAVKSGMANIAAGNYSGGGFATGGTSSSMVGDYESRDVNVNVTGTLQADGDQLVAVINNSNKKSYYTT